MSFIGVDITSITTLNARLKKLPREAQDQGVETANAYIVNLMRTYPAKSSAPFVWSSDRQRKAVMAKYRSGEAGGRTQALRTGWKVVGSGMKQIVANEVPYAIYVQGEGQIVGHTSNGWQTTAQIIKSKSKGILQKFEEGVRKAIRKLGL